jgi:hypothetical protein
MPILDRCNDAVMAWRSIAELLWRRLARNGWPNTVFCPTRQAVVAKIFLFTEFRVVVCCIHSGPRKRGVSRSSRHAGRTAVDMDHIGARGFAGRATVSESSALTTVWFVDGKIVWSWRPGFWRQVLR